MRVNIEYRTPTGRRPKWLLSFAAMVRAAFDKTEIQEQGVTTTMSVIEGILDNTIMARRTTRTNCSCVPREVREYNMDVYSATGKMKLLTISIR